MKHAIGLLGPFLLAGGVLSAVAQDPVVGWIKSQAVPLKTVAAGNGFADMAPLKKMIGDARIVALGEATHGTREFFQLKHRMLEFLATEMGFTIFSIEANMPEAYRINDYVLTGAGDPAELLRGMYFWTWDTEEVLELIRWMRRYNEAGKGKLEFTGFDMQTPTVAMRIVQDFVAAREPGYAATIVEAAELTRRASVGGGPTFGVATGSFPPSVAAGKRVRFSGYIRTEGITRGYAGLWWRADGKAGILVFDNMANRGVTGTTDWTRHDIELTVPAEAVNINFGAILTGNGAAWFDDWSVEVDGRPYADPARFDFQFESPTVTGFATGGNGYGAGLDNKVFRGGTQSLHLRSVSAATAPPPPEVAAKAAAAWSEVVSHLDQARATYRSAGATDRDVDWTIQNATIVLQGLRSRTNRTVRDRSMAENIKWILDRSPNARIVLWAHNAHVASGGFGFETMGQTLRKMYGSAMVVMGFAFNQGGFQAMEQGKGLTTFTVPPAPPGSLDATLASTGLPIFALDLRSAPQAGPVADWLAQPHASRTIGAVYSDATAATYLMPLRASTSYDVLLFVESTTAARKNPGR